MNRTLYWKKGIFKCVYKIYNAGKYVGKLIENPWSQSARGVLNDKSLLFKVKNALMPKIVIEEAGSRQVIGKIKFNCWWSKAIIQYGDKRLTWRYTNWLSTKWVMVDEKGYKMEYQGSSYKGSIYNGLEDDGLLLTGLFIANYYWQMITIYFVVIFFPMLFFAY